MKDRIQDWLETTIPEDESILMCDNLHDAFIGLIQTENHVIRAVYDADKVISVLVRDGMTYEEALEFYEFNILGSYVGPATPLFLTRFPEA